MLPSRSNVFPGFSRFFEDDWSDLFDWTKRSYSDTQTTVPSVNIKEGANEFKVEVAAPGMNKEDFHIELHNNVLRIRSERKTENEEKDGDRYTRREFSYQSFERRFNLNNTVVDSGKIDAKYESGILTLTLPKKEEAKEKPARVIEIS